MVEHRPWLTFLTHAILLLGCLVIAFPIYTTFVASTHSLETITSLPSAIIRMANMTAAALLFTRTADSAPVSFWRSDSMALPRLTCPR